MQKYIFLIILHKIVNENKRKLIREIKMHIIAYPRMRIISLLLNESERMRISYKCTYV